MSKTSPLSIEPSDNKSILSELAPFLLIDALRFCSFKGRNCVRFSFIAVVKILCIY